MGRRFRRRFSRLAILSPFAFSVSVSLSLPLSLSLSLSLTRSSADAIRAAGSAAESFRQPERLVRRLFLDPAPLPTPL